ncbi:Hypothetical protein DSVG11_2957 [Desulfovibrio sp. G11]|nr:Hypothetical protein DSVG11_2957 [Desulfovibrio sp. G11]
MLLTKDTTIHFLTSEYPFLIESLALHNGSFERL